MGFLFKMRRGGILIKRPDKGANASRVGSVPAFLKKPIAICGFPRRGGGGPDPLPPLDRPMLMPSTPGRCNLMYEI